MVKNELATIPPKDYKIVTMDPERRDKLLAQALSGQALTIQHLDRAKMPSGGMAIFEVPGLEGVENPKELTGVVLGAPSQRVFWREPYGKSEGAPPDCHSVDCIAGVGDPGGSCHSCPFNEWGSGTDSAGEPTRGKACAERRLIFLMRPQSTLPLIVNLPPTSIGPASKYFLRLAGHDILPHEVVTTIGLEKAKNGGGIEHAVATFKIAEKLPDELARKFGEIADALAPQLEQVARSEAQSGAGEGEQSEFAASVHVDTRGG